MKILLVNKFHYLKGGAERVYFETKALLERNGHEVVCFSMADPKNEPCAQEKYFVANTDFGSRENLWHKFFRNIYYGEAARKLEALILAEKPDIAHLHNISHYLTASILKPLKKYGIPVVQTLHDYQLICPNYHLFVENTVCERCKEHRYYNAILHRCLRHDLAYSLLGALELTAQWIFRFYRESVDVFIAPSHFLANKLEQWKVKQRIEVVPNFLELKEFVPEYANEGYLVCVSRLSSEKGIMTLIRAIRKVPEIKLKLIGEGPERKHILEYLKKKQVRNVECLGAKFGTELFDIVKGAKFAVVPSENYENAPMFVLEAMALGKPVLASDLGGLAEMVKDGYNGWLFPVGNIKALRSAIKKQFLNDNLEKIGHNARLSVEEKFDAEQHYKQLMAVYESLIK